MLYLAGKPARNMQNSTLVNEYEGISDISDMSI